MKHAYGIDHNFVADKAAATHKAIKPLNAQLSKAKNTTEREAIQAQIDTLKDQWAKDCGFA